MHVLLCVAHLQHDVTVFAGADVMAVRVHLAHERITVEEQVEPPKHLR